MLSLRETEDVLDCESGMSKFVFTRYEFLDTCWANLRRLSKLSAQHCPFCPNNAFRWNSRFAQHGLHLATSWDWSGVPCSCAQSTAKPAAQSCRLVPDVHGSESGTPVVCSCPSFFRRCAVVLVSVAAFLPTKQFSRLPRPTVRLENWCRKMHARKRCSVMNIVCE